MARTQYTFTFTNAQPGADVGFNFPAYADASTPDADGPAVVLDSTNSVSVWADSDYLIAHTVDGRGVQIVGVATHAYPTQTIDAGVAGFVVALGGNAIEILADTANTILPTADGATTSFSVATSALVAIPPGGQVGPMYAMNIDPNELTLTFIEFVIRRAA